jgi:hypothetical protein
VVVAVYVAEGGEFEVVEAAARTALADQFS